MEISKEDLEDFEQRYARRTGKNCPMPKGKHRWHRQLLALADEYGFGLKACRPYRAKTKGKVERFNGYLKGSLLSYP